MFVSLLIYSHLLVCVDSKPTTSPNSGISMTSSSDYIMEGITQSLSLQCVHVQNQIDDVTLSVTLSHSDDGMNFKNIAVLTPQSADLVNVLDDLGARVEGRLGNNGTSFITYKWKYPELSAVGVYKCTVMVMQHDGRFINLSTADGIKTKTVNIEDIQDTVRQLYRNQDKLAADLSQTKELLNETRQELNFESLVDLNLTHSIGSYIDKAFFVSSTYKNHTYWLSRPYTTDVLKFNSICVAKGGYLVEIDDSDEYNFVDSFFKINNYPWQLHSFIGITDFGHQTNWKFIHSGKTVHAAAMRWEVNQYNYDGYDCAYISSDSQFMYDYYCADSLVARFICEIPA